MLDYIQLKQNPQDKNVDSALTQLRQGIVKFNKIRSDNNSQYLLPVQQALRERIFTIFDQPMYWNTLLESEYIDPSDPEETIQQDCQDRKKLYQQALTADNDIWKTLLPIPTEENKQVWDSFLPNEKKRKRDAFKEQIDRVKKLEKEHATKKFNSGEAINQQIAVLLSLIRQCNDLIFYLGSKRKNKKIINQMIDYRLSLIQVCTDLGDQLIEYLDWNSRYGHTDKLYICLQQMQKQYPHAAIECPGVPINFLPPTQIKTTYYHLNRIVKLQAFIPQNYEEKLKTIKTKLFSVVQNQEHWKTSKNNKTVVDLKDKKIAHLVTQPAIATSMSHRIAYVSQQSQMIIKPFQGNKTTEMSAALYYHALVTNQQGLNAFHKEIENMGWSLTIEWIFSEWIYETKRYKAYRTVERTLRKQQQDLQQWAEQNDFNLAITAEIDTIFKNGHQLTDITQQLQTVMAHFINVKVAHEVNQKVINARVLYQTEVNKHIIRYIIQNIFNDLGVQFNQSSLNFRNLEKILEPKEIQNLINFIRCTEGQSISHESKTAVNRYLQQLNFDTTIDEIQIKAANDFLNQYDDIPKNINEIGKRVFDPKALVFLHRNSQANLLLWVRENEELIKQININQINSDNIVAWVNYSKLNITASRLNDTEATHSLNIFESSYSQLIELFKQQIEQEQEIKNIKKYFTMILAIGEYENLKGFFIDKLIQLTFSLNETKYDFSELMDSHYVHSFVTLIRSITNETLTASLVKKLLSGLQDKALELNLILIRFGKKLEIATTLEQEDTSRIKSNVYLVIKEMVKNKIPITDPVKDFVRPFAKDLIFSDIVVTFNIQGEATKKELKNHLETVFKPIPESSEKVSTTKTPSNQDADTVPNQNLALQNFQGKINTFKEKVTENHSFETLIFAFEKLVKQFKETGLNDITTVRGLRKLYKEKIYSKGQTLKSSEIKQVKTNLRYLEMALDQSNSHKFNSPAETAKEYNSKFFSSLNSAIQPLDNQKIDTQAVNQLTLG